MTTKQVQAGLKDVAKELEGRVGRVGDGMV